MNFLAHIYLSGDRPLIKLGNFIGDYVKGRNYETYPDQIKEGILLHRAIDSYTDAHPLHADLRKLLHPVYRKYAGVVADVLLDHVLASQWERHHESELKKFAKQFYYLMVQHYRYLPYRVRMFLPFMIQSNRLASYAKEEGLYRALDIMSNNTSLPNETKSFQNLLNKENEVVFALANEFLQEVKEEFLSSYPEVVLKSYK